MNHSLTRDEKIEHMMISFMAVFSSLGLDGASVRKLAGGAGINEALVYRYFDNKDHVIKQCAAVYHTKIQKELTDILIDNIEQFHVIADRLMDYIDEHLDTCRFLLQVMAHPIYADYTAETAAVADGYLMDFAKAMAEHSGFGMDIAEGVTLLLNSIINDYVLKKDKQRFFKQLTALEQPLMVLAPLQGV